MVLNQNGYDVIVADPPWRFATWSKKGMDKSPEVHYPTMTIDDIKALPVSDYAAEDCVLLVWGTYPLLRECIDTGEAWGFTYKTCGFTWAKRTKNWKWHWGMGYWTRANPELALLFTRGKPKRASAGVLNLLEARVREHSRKPDEFYHQVKKLMGSDKQYLELFAREQREGWACVGNEIDGRDIRDVITKR